MQLTILLLLACQVFGQDEGEVYSSGESDVDGQGPQQPPIAILSQHQELGDDGTFEYSFSTDNGLQQKEAFHPDGSRTGAYSYVDPQGETVLVHYRADRFGFHILDGSSIPTTPPHAGRLQGHPSNDGSSERLRRPSAPDTNPYEVEEFDGESSALRNKKISSLPAARPIGLEMARTAKNLNQHNRFYRSAAKEPPVKVLEGKPSDLDSIAAKDLSVAASSYHPFGLPRYVPVQQQTSAYKSPYASLARQVQYPVKKGKAEAEVEDGNANGTSGEHAAATDNGDYNHHTGRHDDGSYAYYASKYDDGSYPQHAVKYDDGSYDKYARIYGEGQYSDSSRQYADEVVGQAEHEAGYVRQPGEAEVSHY